MKIIEPLAELIDDLNTADVYKKIERCGRVSRQSKTKGNAADFVCMLIKRGHESVLEHVSLTFQRRILHGERSEIALKCCYCVLSANFI